MSPAGVVIDDTTGDADGNVVYGDESAVYMEGSTQCVSSSSTNSCGLTMVHVEESPLSKVVVAGVTIGNTDGDGDAVVNNEIVV